ncbi:MAG: ADP-forming succinate--CoA ligase subunit beta [Nevskiales bacterium]
MNLHEYQARDLFDKFGIAIGQARLARSPDEAVSAAQALGGSRWVVKAQVHAGGRGKAGGVKLVDSTEKVREAAKGMLGKQLVTKQTGAAGLPIHSVLVAVPQDIARELYLSVLVDRSRECILYMASAAGGMDIEEVAAKTPEKILTLPVHPAAGLSPFVARRIGFFLGLNAEQVGQLGKMLAGIHRLFMETDASLIEVNPLIVSPNGQLSALDAKINLDDNALYRHPELEALRDPKQEDEHEREAAEHDLNYVSLEGDIGCMVNGAGLAMATMDIIKLHGGQPANFLDVGGGATKERVTEAFKLITSNPKVKAILINIFGGIVRCDLIADGIIAAVKEVGLKIPVVTRLEGTNVEKGRELLANSGYKIIPATDLTDAAKKAVAAARG